MPAIAPIALDALCTHIIRLIRGDFLTDLASRQTKMRDDSVPEAVFYPADTADLQAVLHFLYTEAEHGIPVPLLLPSETEEVGHTPWISVDFSRARNMDSEEKCKVVLANGDVVEIKDLGPAELEAKQHHHNFEGKIYRELHNHHTVDGLDIRSCFQIKTVNLGFLLGQVELPKASLAKSQIEALKKIFDPYHFLNPAV